MIAIAWIVGIGIFLWLLFSFPKRMGTVMTGGILAVATVAGILIAYFTYSDSKKDQRIAAIEARVEFSSEKCGKENPLRVGFSNGSNVTIREITFRVKGFRKNYSKPLYDSGYLGFSTDRIVAAGEDFSECWRVPNKEPGITEKVFSENPPAQLQWTINVVRTIADE